ncbi:unnamed protein product [Calicophoron daubneyi]|uniref:Otopetrin n=1 Tax=Calicophoron daubneyi TaxID=300641 RepID=A0AAV2SW28_CALDB
MVSWLVKDMRPQRQPQRQQDSVLSRPSVALADYEIGDTRSSAMSSLLLLFAVLEGMCGFVLPICTAFSTSTANLRVSYYENFLLVQYCMSILSLFYLQALIFYYDQKENIVRKKLGRPHESEQDRRCNRRATDPEVTYGRPTELSALPPIMGGSVRLPSEEPDTQEVQDIDEEIRQVIQHGQRYSDEGTPPDHLALPNKQIDGEIQNTRGVLNSLISQRPSGNVPRFQFQRMPTSSNKVAFTLTPHVHSSSEGRPSPAPSVERSNTTAEIHSDEAPTPPSLPTPDKGDGDSQTTSTTKHSNEDLSGNTDEGLESLPPVTTMEDRPWYLRSEPVIEFPEAHTTSTTPFRKTLQAPLRFIFGDKPKPSMFEMWYFSRDSEGVNLYLRLGAVGFGFGVMIFDGFKIAEPWEAALNNSPSCHGSLWVPIHLFHFIYVFWQTYFIFKHHQVVFNVQKFVLRFLLCHLAVSNLCQWLKTVVDEISTDHVQTEDLSHVTSHMITSFGSELASCCAQSCLNTSVIHGVSFTGSSPVGHHNATTVTEPHPVPSGTLPVTVTHAPAHTQTGCRSTAKHMAAFLFPCAIEYSLIAGAIFYKMFQKVGHVRKESERLARLREANNISSNFSECHRSHKGLFIGLLMFMATLVTMSLFFLFFVKSSKRKTAITLYQSTELILLALGILTCVITLIRLRVLKFSELSEEGAFDANLLLVGLVGIIFYDLFLLIPAIEAIPSGRMAAKLFATKAILEIFQSMLQVFFILEGSRRCAGSTTHVQDKPGRTMVTFLLILNLAMWFVNTFEVKRADNHSIHIDFYTGMAWKIITHIALPLIVFFRFHSTVCLSDIWANAYRFRTE